MKKYNRAHCGGPVSTKKYDYSKTDVSPYRLPKGTGLQQFISDLNGEGQIRFYYIRSVKWDNNKAGLYQFGCGLNLKSRLATLSTCKRDMLQTIYKHWDDETKPLYIGVLGTTEGRKLNSETPLLFLGKVDQVFYSFDDMWDKLPPKIRASKDVRKHPLGDMYPPNFKKSSFANKHVHSINGIYRKDLKYSCPLVFKQWRAWPDADIVFKENKSIAKASEKFKRMIKKPAQMRHGWVYSLAEVKPVLRPILKSLAKGEL